MPLLLRKLTKQKWQPEYAIGWLSEGDLQADALNDLATQNNELSVFHIEDDKSNLNRVIAALAAKRDNLDKLDYALMASEIADDPGFNIRMIKGDTADEAVNQWHRDITELTVAKLADLAVVIKQRGQIYRLLQRDVKSLLVQSAASGHIKRSLITNERMLNHIDKLLIEKGQHWPE
jgi:hypothetical protein